MFVQGPGSLPNLSCLWLWVEGSQHETEVNFPLAGSIASTAYPLESLDTIDQRTGNIVTKSAINLIVFGVGIRTSGLSRLQGFPSALRPKAWAQRPLAYWRGASLSFQTMCRFVAAFESGKGLVLRLASLETLESYCILKFFVDLLLRFYYCSNRLDFAKAL